MKLVEAIYKVDRSLANQEQYIDIDDFTDVLGLQTYLDYDRDKFNDRFKSYWLKKRMCTDTWVGIRVYFLDHKLIAVGHQKARKCYNEIEFINQTAANNLRDFILNLQPDREYPELSEQDLEQDIGEYYNVNYYGDLLTKQGIYQDRTVKVIDTRRPYMDPASTEVAVCYVDDADQHPFTILVKDFKIPWHVNMEAQDYD